MPTRVRFELARVVDGNELVEFLRAGGFAAELVQTDDHIEVDVSSADAEPSRVRADVWGAVETWLAEREPVLVPTPADDDVIVLSPPAD